MHTLIFVVCANSLAILLAILRPNPSLVKFGLVMSVVCLIVSIFTHPKIKGVFEYIKLFFK